MRTSSLLFISFLLSIFSANLLLSSALDVSAPVLDTAGRELHRGVSYYILPAESNNGGGVTLENYRGAQCPFLITQDPVEGNNGFPVEFSPVNPNDSVIRLSTDLNIKFTGNPTGCPQSSVWMLTAAQSSEPPLFVTVGGAEGNPGPKTIPNWFKIQRYEDAYQIEFCPDPSLCGDVLCRILCGNIGIISTGGLRRLTINQPVFKIVFQRA